MSVKKPIPLIEDRAQRICPVCGKQSYSRDGIHPQCAVQQADAPRTRQNKAEKKNPPKKGPDTIKTRLHRWKKQCPKCGVELHVSSKACGCGHRFVR